MNAPLSRRAAIFGAVTITGLSAAACSPAKGHTAVAPLTIMHPSPDAALILLAGRVEALAGRLFRAQEHICDLQDRVFVAERDRPEPLLPPKPSSDTVIERRDTATENVMVTRWPRVPDPAWEARRQARDAAEAAKERRTAAHGARLGLPALERRAGRMHRRLHRWAWQLAETEAATAAGLSAKARTFLALGGGGRDGLEFATQDHPDLALSILTAVSAETWVSA